MSDSITTLIDPINLRSAVVQAMAREYVSARTAGRSASILKNDRREGVDVGQLDTIRGHRRNYLGIVEYHIRRLVQIANLAVAFEVRGEVVADAVSTDVEAGEDVDLGDVFGALHVRPTEWTTVGQVSSGGVNLPWVVDSPEALEQALDLLSAPPTASGAELGELPCDATRPVAIIADPAIAEVAALSVAVEQLAVALTDRAFTEEGGLDELDVVSRLLSSVLRPLFDAIALAGELEFEVAPIPTLTQSYRTNTSAQLLLDVADRATAMVTGSSPSGLLEAVAALQQLATRAASTSEELHDRWWTRSIATEPMIRASRNGPYLATGVRDVVDHLGSPTVESKIESVSALCRCGQSALKPFCDGSHARIDFTGEKSSKRVPDHRDTHDGLQVTVLDNRGTCAHSGFCTSRLPVVFRQGKEPFVAASGGRMDEVVRAVRACPSGALSYAIEEREAREQIDQHRQPCIEVSKDGPYRVTGGITLHDGEGVDEVRNEGASHEHYSLCRCGQSQNKPFCSGMHWYVNFLDPVRDPNEVPTVFEWAGGLPALRRLTRLFYEKYIPEDPLLAPVFARMSTDHPERVAKWLGEVFGGPKYFTDEFGGYTRMISQHIGKGLTEAQRSRWAALMVQSANDAELPSDPEFRAAFVSYIEWGSRLAVENSQTDAAPPANMPVPQWWWVCNATPLARVSAQSPVAEEELIELPDDDVELTFETHIRPLFRATDRNSMKFAFDLWAVADVTTHADAILSRLHEGTMPCDGSWPAERIEVFRRWVAADCAP